MWCSVGLLWRLYSAQLNLKRSHCWSISTLGASVFSPATSANLATLADVLMCWRRLPVLHLLPSLLLFLVH